MAVLSWRLHRFLRPSTEPKYNRISNGENAGATAYPPEPTHFKVWLVNVAMHLFVVLVTIVLIFFPVYTARLDPSMYQCDDVTKGYECKTDVSHKWGQYSPWYSVPASGASAALPAGCAVTFAQVLSRHGARSPTEFKSQEYKHLVAKIKRRVKTFSGKYKFLKTYEYDLGSGDLTPFGRQEMVNSGTHFFNRYQNLANQFHPFIRSSGRGRVLESAEKWIQGYSKARGRNHESKPDNAPYYLEIVEEELQSNNTMSHNLCTSFSSEVGEIAQTKYASIFVPPIRARLNKGLRHAALSTLDTIYMMDLCPFETVAFDGTYSPFCDLFTADEWLKYDYFQSLGKYYGHGDGNYFGPTQGVGYVNELIARLTGDDVIDHTSTNHTTTSNSTTFPVGKKHPLFADFGHDNGITSILAALNTYAGTSLLSNRTYQNMEQTHGYSASWTVPFAARIYIEKLKCRGEKREHVRVIVNDRVRPMPLCGGDIDGRCNLEAFVDSLRFARKGGRWDECTPDPSQFEQHSIAYHAPTPQPSSTVHQHAVPTERLDAFDGK